MLLAPDFVGFPDPVSEGLVQLRGQLQTEGVQVAAWGTGFYLVEARGLVTCVEDQMPFQRPPLRLQRGETHAHLQCDAALLRDDRHRSARANRF